MINEKEKIVIFINAKCENNKLKVIHIILIITGYNWKHNDLKLHWKLITTFILEHIINFSNLKFSLGWGSS
jgi:hypothetical protein